MKFLAFLLFFVTFIIFIAESRKVVLPLEFPKASAEIFFDCNDNKFISKELICNGYEDCLSGVDEDDCEEVEQQQ